MVGLDLGERRHVRRRLLDGVAAARLERAGARRREHVARGAVDRRQPARAATRRGAARSAAGRACTGGAAGRRSRRRAPASMNMPPYITFTRSHMPATTPRSWVIRISAMSRVGDERAQQVEDLRLDRHVERRRRLVGDQELRLARERHRDHRALAHAARELVRVVADAARRRPGCPPASSSSTARFSRPLAVQVEVRLERLADLPADRQHRVQARHRVLEDHRDLACRGSRGAPCRGAGAGRGPRTARVPPTTRPARGRMPRSASDGDALAAARLADDAERLAGGDRERDPVDRVDRPARCPELHPKLVDREQRRAGSELPNPRLLYAAARVSSSDASALFEALNLPVRPRSFGSSASRRPSPIRLKPSTRSTMATPGMIARKGALWR